MLQVTEFGVTPAADWDQELTLHKLSKMLFSFSCVFDLHHLLHYVHWCYVCLPFGADQVLKSFVADICCLLQPKMTLWAQLEWTKIVMLWAEQLKNELKLTKKLCKAVQSCRFS